MSTTWQKKKTINKTVETIVEQYTPNQSTYIFQMYPSQFHIAHWPSLSSITDINQFSYSGSNSFSAVAKLMSTELILSIMATDNESSDGTQLRF
jgi:hypothetical protein